MELHIVNFIKTLPPRDRTFYLLMRSYERDLSDVKQYSLNEENTRETLRGIAEIYEFELLPLIESDIKSPIYNTQFNRNENAEPSSSESILEHVNMSESLGFKIETKRSLNGAQTVTLFDDVVKNLDEFDEFAESLGPWASSFSSNSGESSQPYDDVVDIDNTGNIFEEKYIVIRANNDSDLSSDDE